MACDSSSGFRQGYHTFLYGHKKYNRGRKGTNEQYGLRSAPSVRGGSFRTLFCTDFRASCRLSLGVYFSRNFYKATSNANSSWLVFPHCFLLLSRSRLFLCDSLRQLPSLGSFANCPSLGSFAAWPSLGSFADCLSSPTSGLVGDLESKPFGFAPKQTKGSSAWWTTNIVSQGTSIPGQNKPRNNIREGILHSLQISKIGASPSDAV